MRMGFASRQRIIIIPALVSAAMILIGVASGDMPVLGNLIIISTIIFTVPLFLHKYSKYMWIKSVEEQFPNFVRDLADSSRSGMSLPESIGIAAKANYGKLSPEVQRMNNRLSWGTPFLNALDIFQRSVKSSRVIMEALSIIRQSYEAGGSIPDTLDAVSRDMVMLKEAEAERISLVRQQVMIMYGLFYIFLGISVMIIYVMVPMLSSQSTMSSGLSGAGGLIFSNPCEGGSIFPCGLFAGTCVVFGVGQGITCYYVAMFFSVVMIEGICTGLIAGQLGENSAIAGFKHSLIMVFSSFGVFMFLSKIGVFPVG